MAAPLAASPPSSALFDPRGGGSALRLVRREMAGRRVRRIPERLERQEASSAVVRRLAQAPGRPPDWVELLARRPLYAPVLADPAQALASIFDLMSETSPVWDYALEFTAFGLDQFKSRADRDGAALVVLTTYRVRMMDDRGAPFFATLNAMAEERGVPVIDQHEYVLRQGMDIRDVHWERDAHWNADGHRLAAEAVLEWLGENRWVCDDAPIAGATRR